ncbi:MAG: hypothetical protein QM774_06770 [Gordonia sp. (in: high G+C Gram-positive bacteria)]|uniref:hypothetical protein n=1 Tax=Gordonia sp. (in: high G+C Gram-positive bacteria) TaxID=84139 RepID=UPI0039E6055A
MKTVSAIVVAVAFVAGTVLATPPADAAIAPGTYWMQGAFGFGITGPRAKVVVHDDKLTFLTPKRHSTAYHRTADGGWCDNGKGGRYVFHRMGTGYVGTGYTHGIPNATLVLIPATTERGNA